MNAAAAAIILSIVVHSLWLLAFQMENGMFLVYVTVRGFPVTAPKRDFTKTHPCNRQTQVGAHTNK